MDISRFPAPTSFVPLKSFLKGVITVLPIARAKMRTTAIKKTEIKNRNSIKSSVAFDISSCSKGKGREMRRREFPRK